MVGKGSGQFKAGTALLFTRCLLEGHTYCSSSKWSPHIKYFPFNFVGSMSSKDLFPHLLIHVKTLKDESYELTDKSWRCNLINHYTATSAWANRFEVQSAHF